MFYSRSHLSLYVYQGSNFQELSVTLAPVIWNAWFHLTSTLFFSNAMQINSVLYNSGVEITLELHFSRTSHKYLCTVQITNQDINTIFGHNPLFLTSAPPHLRFTKTWLHNGRHSTQEHDNATLCFLVLLIVLASRICILILWCTQKLGCLL